MWACNVLFNTLSLFKKKSLATTLYYAKQFNFEHKSKTLLWPWWKQPVAASTMMTMTTTTKIHAPSAINGRRFGQLSIRNCNGWSNWSNELATEENGVFVPNYHKCLCKARHRAQWPDVRRRRDLLTPPQPRRSNVDARCMVCHSYSFLCSFSVFLNFIRTKLTKWAEIIWQKVS